MKKILPQDITRQASEILGDSESKLRNQLAHLYHIMDYYGWCDIIFTHISARIPGTDTFLFNPFGLSFSEITPESIVKVKLNGETTSDEGWPINRNGSKAHIAIYRAKPEVNCIIHTHSKYGVAISNLDTEVMGLDQITMFLHSNVGYHDFEQLFALDDEQKQLTQDLGDHDCLILRNHGLLAVGPSIPRAFWNYYYLEFACQTQILSMSSGAPLKNPLDTVKEETGNQYKQWKNPHNIFPPDDELLFLAAIRKVQRCPGNPPPT